jgi:HlyD family secretion protein
MKTDALDAQPAAIPRAESNFSPAAPPATTVSGASVSTVPPTTTAAAPSPARRNNQRRHRRRWLPWAGALVLVGLLVAGLWPQPAPVETAPAVVGTLRATVNEEGKTRIRQRFVVSAPVAGQLRRIPFKAGAEVKAGETVVAVIEPLAPALLDARARSLAEARRDTAAAQRERARAQHTFAVSELRRFEKLAATRTVSPQELETVQWREAAAAKELAAAESALRQAEAELAEFGAPAGSADNPRAPVEVKAPASGRLLRVFEESARVVAAGTPLVEVGDPADLEVVIEVLSRDGAAIAPGTKVWLEHWGGETPLEARVRLVEPAAFTKVSALGVEEQRVNVIADILTPMEQRRTLGDNFRVEARIIVWESAGTLKVPSGAVFRRGQQWSAFVVTEGRARWRPVTVGRSSGSEVQILDGLKTGETVVLYPGDRLRDGQRVRPITI